MKKSSLIVLVFILFSCSEKINVSKQTKKENLKETFFYALPRNVLEFEIKLKKTSYSEGDEFIAIQDCCVDYLAKKYDIDSSDLEVLRKKSSFAHTAIEKDGFLMNAGAKPDTNKIYAINVSPKFFRDNVVGLAFTQDWLLSEASLSSENKSFDIALNTVSTLLGIAGKITGKGIADKDDLIPGCECDTNYKKLDVAIGNLTDFINAAFTSSYLVDAYKDAKLLKQKEIEKLFADYFYEKKERAYSVKFTLDIPNGFDISGNTGKNLFWIEEETGKLIINKELEGYIKTINPDKIDFGFANKEAKWYTLTATQIMDDVYSAIQVKLPDETTSSSFGFVYNIPATINIKIIQPKNKTVLYNNAYKFAQFGKQGFINQKLTKISLTLDPLTGSLQKVSGESKSIATSNISGTADALNKGYDLFKKPTEAEELEKKIKILELRAKLKELEGTE